MRFCRIHGLNIPRVGGVDSGIRVVPRGPNGTVAAIDESGDDNTDDVLAEVQ